MNTAISPDTKEKLISKGLESFIKGAYSEAAAHFEEILSNTPSDCDALYHLAGCQIQSRQYEAAQASIEKALELNPRNFLAWFRLGQIHYTCKRYESAVDSFGKAIEINPEYADAWFMGGQGLIENGDINDGMLALKNALDLNPSSPIFNAVFANHFIKNKRQIGNLIASGSIEEILLCINFLLENIEFNLKITVITDYKEVGALFKSKSISVDKILLCDNKLEVIKLYNKISRSREHYPCPKKWPH